MTAANSAIPTPSAMIPILARDDLPSMYITAGVAGDSRVVIRLTAETPCSACSLSVRLLMRALRLLATARTRSGVEPTTSIDSAGRLKLVCHWPPEFGRVTDQPERTPCP